MDQFQPVSLNHTRIFWNIFVSSNRIRSAEQFRCSSFRKTTPTTCKTQKMRDEKKRNKCKWKTRLPVHIAHYVIPLCIRLFYWDRSIYHVLLCACVLKALNHPEKYYTIYTFTWTYTPIRRPTHKHIFIIEWNINKATEQTRSLHSLFSDTAESIFIFVFLSLEQYL